jgi:hypothetical protein
VPKGCFVLLGLLCSTFCVCTYEDYSLLLAYWYGLLRTNASITTIMQPMSRQLVGDPLYIIIITTMKYVHGQEPAPSCGCSCGPSAPVGWRPITQDGHHFLRMTRSSIEATSWSCSTNTSWRRPGLGRKRAWLPGNGRTSDSSSSRLTLELFLRPPSCVRLFRAWTTV